MLSLPTRAIWDDRWRPAPPHRFLGALAGEAPRLRDAGAAAVEVHGDICAIDQRYVDPKVWESAAEVLAAEGLGATLHLPFLWTDLASLDDQVWEGSLRSAQAVLEVTAPLDPALAVVHPANYATQAVLQHARGETLQTLMGALGERLVAALTRLREGPGGGVVALENLEGTPLTVILQAAEAAGVAICLDVGHAVSNGDDPLAAVEAVGDRLLGLHLHDAVPPQPAGGRAFGRAHLPLGEGRLDVLALARLLRRRGFEEPVVLEVESDEQPAADSARAWLTAVKAVERIEGLEGREGLEGLDR